MRRIIITRRVTVRTTCVPVVRVRPLPSRPKKPVTVRVGNVTKTIWI